MDNKKRIVQISALALAIMGLLAAAWPVYAADVDDALYTADIVATNTGAATTDFAGVCDINTQALIDGKYVTSDLLNTAIQTSGGTDVAYMPGVGTNPWALFIPSIEGTETRSYILYAGGPAMQTGFYYFPDDGGMTTSDNDASLELGNNFTIVQRGYIDTAAGADKNLVYKNNAIRVYVSAAGSITVALIQPTTVTFYPDPNVEATSVDGKVSEATATTNWATIVGAAGDSANDSDNAGSFINISSSAVANTWSDLTRSIFLFDTNTLPDATLITSATFSVYGSAKYDTFSPAIAPNINLYGSTPASNVALAAGDYAQVQAVPFCNTPITYAGWNIAGYNAFVLNTAGLAAINKTGVSKFGMRNANYDVAVATPTWSSNAYAQLYGYFADQVGQTEDPKLVVTYGVLTDIVTANPVASGVHTITVTLSGGTLSLQIDSETPVTVAFAGSVPNNSNNWSFLTNGSMPYMEYHKIWIGGTAPANLKQHIVYERDTTFDDLTANNNDATPTFRTTPGTLPVVQGRSTGATTAVDTTSHAITLPGGIAAGELLLVIFSVDGNPTCTDGSGLWTKLGQTSYSTTVTQAIFYKIATGGDTLTITTSVAEQSSHVALRISGAGIPTATAATGDSTNSNPPNHTPAITANYLWVATRSGDSTVVATAAPASYNSLQSQAAAGADGASTNTAERPLNASSEDPGVFTSAIEQWVSYTISIGDADISVTFQNFEPIEAAEYTGGSEEETPEMLTTVPDEPEEMYGGEEGGSENIPGAELINPLLEEADFPTDFFWIVAIYGLAAVFVVLSYQFIRSSLLFPAIAGFCVILFFALVTKGDPIPLWTIYPYILNSAGFLVMEKTFGW